MKKLLLQFLLLGSTSLLPLSSIANAKEYDYNTACKSRGANAAWAIGESKGFFVSICTAPSGRYKNGATIDKFYYLGVSKSGGSIYLPIVDYRSNADRYIAVNGDITYIFTDSFLTVTKNRKIILKEKITHYDRGGC